MNLINIWHNEIFSKNLIELLNNRNKKQIDMCRDLNIPKATVSSWCRGTRTPKLSNLFIIAEYLELKDVSLLLVDNNNINDDINKKIDKINKVNKVNKINKNS